MNGMHFYLWHYWDVTAYFGCALLLVAGIAVVWCASKLVNRTWASRHSGPVFLYALFISLVPAVLYFNAAAAQRIAEQGPQALSRHVYQMRQNGMYYLLLDTVQSTPPNADARKVNSTIFCELCRYMQEQSFQQKNALPLPQGIPADARPKEPDLQRFFYDEVFRNRNYPAQLDSLITESRVKEINKAVTAYLCTAAWEQNEQELQEASCPLWGFCALWCGGSLLLVMGQAFADIKKITPYVG